jgi:dihydrolipoamide dehydrogenase
LYTWPEVASVGEWTHSAQAKGLDLKAQRFFFQGSAKALADEDTEGFLQILSEKGGGRLLGAQIIGPHATELIHIFSVALKAGMTAKDLHGVIFAHPTLAEGVREALAR